jgi:hypothetical protein
MTMDDTAQGGIDQLLAQLIEVRSTLNGAHTRARAAAACFHAEHGAAWARLMAALRREDATLRQGHDLLLAIDDSLRAQPLAGGAIDDLTLDAEFLTMPISDDQRYLELTPEELAEFDGFASDAIYHQTVVLDAVIRRLTMALSRRI